MSEITLTDQWFRDVYLPEIKQSRGLQHLTLDDVVKLSYNLNILHRTANIKVTSPAAGAEFIYTVPEGVIVRPHGIVFQFAASAVVATRNVSIVVDDGTTTLIRQFPNINQTANQTKVYYGMEDINTTGVEILATNPIFNWPKIPFIEPGWRIKSLTNNIDVGDAYTAINIIAERCRIQWPQ